MRKYGIFLVISLIVLCLLAIFAYYLPATHDKLAWRLENLKADIQYAVNPPQGQVFVPRAPSQPALTGLPEPSLTPTIALATLPPIEASTSIPTQAPTATLIPTPVPTKAVLKGIVHEYQTWNNCGPANLAMALSFWGWKGSQKDTASYLKPNVDDKSVMPYEMEAFIQEKTDLQAVTRVGGDLLTIKAFISAGFPVLARKGFEGTGFDGWMGHYEVINGYDDAKERFFGQDSYKGPNFVLPYDTFLADWRAFDYTYIIIYPADRRQQVLDILGFQAYDNVNYHYAEQKAEEDIKALTGRNLFFALFNKGTNLVGLKDYAGAASAFDAAFANYALIPEAQRPWRIMWYQTGPYFAYYYTGRYQDVINLATTTLDAMSDPVLEESFYWRGLAELALNDREAAIQDFKKSLEVHPDFQPSVEQLTLLGVDLSTK